MAAYAARIFFAVSFRWCCAFNARMPHDHCPSGERSKLPSIILDQPTDARAPAGIMAWRAAVGDLDGKTVSDDGKTIGYWAGSMPAAAFFEGLIEKASAAFGGLTDEDIERARRKASLEVQAEEAHKTTPEETAASDEEVRQTFKRLDEADVQKTVSTESPEGVPLLDRPEMGFGWSGLCPECGNAIKGSPYHHRQECSHFPTLGRGPTYRQRLPLDLPPRERLAKHTPGGPGEWERQRQARQARLRQEKIARGEGVSGGRDYMAEVVPKAKHLWRRRSFRTGGGGGPGPNGCHQVKLRRRSVSVSAAGPIRRLVRTKRWPTGGGRCTLKLSAALISLRRRRRNICERSFGNPTRKPWLASNAWRPNAHAVR